VKIRAAPGRHFVEHNEDRIVLTRDRLDRDAANTIGVATLTAFLAYIALERGVPVQMYAWERVVALSIVVAWIALRLIWDRVVPRWVLVLDRKSDELTTGRCRICRLSDAEYVEVTTFGDDEATVRLSLSRPVCRWFSRSVMVFHTNAGSSLACDLGERIAAFLNVPVRIANYAHRAGRWTPRVWKGRTQRVPGIPDACLTLMRGEDESRVTALQVLNACGDAESLARGVIIAQGISAPEKLQALEALSTADGYAHCHQMATVFAALDSLCTAAIASSRTEAERARSHAVLTEFRRSMLLRPSDAPPGEAGKTLLRPASGPPVGPTEQLLRPGDAPEKR
jgi:hypothetical protein